MVNETGIELTAEGEKEEAIDYDKRRLKMGKINRKMMLPIAASYGVSL